MRTHISRSKEPPTCVVKTSNEDHKFFKPMGFWYSVDGDWERFCASEALDWAQGATYDVVLGKEKILFIATIEQLDAFHEKYSAKNAGRWSTAFIKWDRVAHEYDGIEIAPYQWKRRLDGVVSDWYYSWDCASGCIWNPKGVQILLKEPAP